jgi:glucans biosynthesis protein C
VAAAPYLAVAALPLYVLHQPIVVAVAYGLVRWPAPIIVEWAVIVVISLVLLLAICDLLFRRTAVTRFLFGMRPATRPADPRTRPSERTGPPR